MADLDPLGAEPAYNAEIDPLTYGLTIWDLDRHFYTDSLRHAFGGRRQATLREMVDRLRETYCGKFGCEYMYIQRRRKKSAAEAPGIGSFADLERRQAPHPRNLLQAEEFEHFL